MFYFIRIKVWCYKNYYLEIPKKKKNKQKLKERKKKEENYGRIIKIIPVFLMEEN